MTEAKKDFSSLQKLFAANKLEALHPLRNKVLSLETSETPQSAFKKLIESHVLSAPVHDSKSGKWTGFLDIRDLVAYAILIYEFEEKKEQTERKLRERSPSRGHSPSRGRSGSADKEKSSPRSRADDFLRLVLSHDPTEKATMYRDPTEGVTVRYLSARNKFVPVQADATIEQVVEVLAHGGVARAPVLDKDGKLVDIISQSAILKFIQSNESKCSDALSQTLDSLGLARKKVVTVKDTDTALAAFKKINSEGLQGLAVVNSEGKIVANTSASDVKLFLQAPSYRILNLPIIEYLNVIRRQSLVDIVPVVSVKPDDTLGKAIGKLAATGMHRVFVVDEKHHPVGVVSIADILAKLVKEKPKADDSAGDAKSETKITKS